MTTYFYMDKAKQEIGPLDLMTLSKFRLADVLDDDTPVRRSDSGEWKPYREIIACPPSPSKALVAKGTVKKSSNGIFIALVAIIIVVVIAARFGPEHADEAERAFREQIKLQSKGTIKLVNFRATSGKPFFETNLFNSSVVESYRLNVQAEIEYESDMAPNGVTVHPGDRVRFAGTMNGTKTRSGWRFSIESSKSFDIHVTGASSPILYSQLMHLEKHPRELLSPVSQMNACINNLRLIDSAKQQWALAQHKSTSATPAGSDLQPYLGRGSAGELPHCPSGGTYIFESVGEKPQCTIPGHVLP